MLTLIESSVFTRWVGEYMDDDEYAGFQVFLAANPEAGDVIPGSGGVCKIRWARKGMGRRGGIRVVYYVQRRRQEIWLLTIYVKSKLDNVPARVVMAMKEAFEHGKS